MNEVSDREYGRILRALRNCTVGSPLRVFLARVARRPIRGPRFQLDYHTDLRSLFLHEVGLLPDEYLPPAVRRLLEDEIFSANTGVPNRFYYYPARALALYGRKLRPEER